MLINILCFQIGWFASVLGAAHDMPWLGPLIALPIVGWHVANAGIKRSEFMLIFVVALLGSSYDQSLLAMGWVQYPASAWPMGLLPVWMTGLWLLFATTLNVSLRWLRGRPAIAMLFGFIGGPLAYLGGAKLGALIWLQSTALLVALALGWALLMPVLLWLAVRLDGYASALNGEPEVV